MGNQIALLLFLFSVSIGISLFAPPAAATAVIETSMDDVNIWAQAGRAGGQKVERVRPFEQVKVIGSKTLSNGETWYQVKVDRYPGWDLVQKMGWVSAKYFTKVSGTPPAGMRAETAAQAVCTNCSTQNNNRELQRQTQPIQALARATGFIWPARGVLRSHYGMRVHPIKKVRRMHRGIDISGNNGAPVHAAKAGIVEVSANNCRPRNASCNGGAGNMITINHDDGTQTRYMHLASNCRMPRKGARVQQGEQISCVGATGRVTGPHLHFEVKKNGQWIDPLDVLPRRGT